MSRISFAILVVAALSLGGCASNGEDQAYCKSVKPGVITSVNGYCAVENDDPVDPSMEPIIWKGQKVALCCEGCRPQWNAMTEAEKDSALARAVAKGMPK